MALSSEQGIVSGALKVKLFRSATVEELEKAVNYWFSSNNVAIRDIIYQHSMYQDADIYSCMVVYTGGY